MDLLCTCTTFSPVTLLRALALRLQFVPSSFEGRQSAMVLAKDLEGENGVNIPNMVNVTGPTVARMSQAAS